MAGLPLVGEKFSTFWGQLADAGSQGLLARVEPYTAQSGRWLLTQVGGLGYMLLQFLLVVVIALQELVATASLQTMSIVRVFIGCESRW